MASTGRTAQILSGFKKVFGEFSDTEKVVNFGFSVLMNPGEFFYENQDNREFRLKNIHTLLDIEQIRDYISGLSYNFDYGNLSGTYDKLFFLIKSRLIELVDTHFFGYYARLLGMSEDELKGKIYFDEDSSDIDNIIKNNMENNSVNIDSSTSLDSESSVSIDKNKLDSKEELLMSNEMNFNQGAQQMPPMPGTQQMPPMPGTQQMPPMPPMPGVNASQQVVNPIEDIRNAYNAEVNGIGNNPLADMNAKMNQQGVGDSVNEPTQSNVKQPSAADRETAARIVSASAQKRKDYTQNSRIIRLLVTDIGKREMAVDGDKTMGTVTDPEKAYNEFCKLTGYHDGMQEIQFPYLNRNTCSWNDAKAMLDVLQAAKADPNFKVKPYYGKSGDPTPVLKGVDIKEPDGNIITKKYSDLGQHMMDHTFMLLIVANKNDSQFILEASRPRGKGSARREPKRAYVIKKTDSKELLKDPDVVVKIKVLDKTKQSTEKGSFKSDLKIVVDTSSSDSANNKKTKTWRIPLTVPHYEASIIDSYEEVFKSERGGVEKKNVTEFCASAKVMNALESILSHECAKGSEGSASTKMLEEFNAIRSEVQKQAVEKQAATLGSAIEPDTNF